MVELINYQGGPLVSPPALPETTPREATAAQQYDLGTRLQLADGRVFRYAKAGATQLEVALMCSAEATHANVKQIVQTGYAAAIGDTIITCLFTTGSGIVDGELRDGWLLVNKLEGLGYSYPIKNNTYLTSDTVAKIELYDAIKVATVAASTEMTFRKNQYADVVVSPTTIVAMAVGIPIVTIPATYFGWLQTKGVCVVTGDTTDALVIGESAGYPATSDVAGAAGNPAVTDHIWGYVIEAEAAAETSLVNLNME